jgi:L-alanine-DL-glutamate epimerase-like enolase superfamily enzyme
MIAEIGLHRLEIPLTTPYKLAFGPVRHFDTLLAEVTLADGRTGLGEATILNGYTEEEISPSWLRLGELSAVVAARGPVVAKTLLGEALARYPFTVTALWTALEMAEGAACLAGTAALSVPILYGLNAVEPAGIERELEGALGAGFRTIKVKVGFDAEADLQRIALIQRLNRGRARLRIDGNQGYSPAEGCRFAARLSPADIELLEQPCAAGDWAAASAVARASPVPLMLDESIYNLDDIDRAADAGARLVKLKLMKMGSLAGLEDGLGRIRGSGMTPVLGNGVAGDIGCWMEAAVAARLIDNAGEMNGFLRPRGHVVSRPLAVEGGRIEVPAGYRPELDRDRLRAWTVGHERIGARTAMVGGNP